MKLHSLTLRPDARPPKGIRGRVIDVGAVVELALLEHAELGTCYLAHAKGTRPRYYLPAAVESCELPDDSALAEERRCAVCGGPLEKTARGETCSRPCARRLGFRRTGQ